MVSTASHWFHQLCHLWKQEPHFPPGYHKSKFLRLTSPMSFILFCELCGLIKHEWILDFFSPVHLTFELLKNRGRVLADNFINIIKMRKEFFCKQGNF